MSKKLLLELNGDTKGQLNKFIEQFIGEPRIAWYPSAGSDFRALLYLHPNYSKLNPASQQEPSPPDLFLFTDYNPYINARNWQRGVIYLDRKTSILIEDIEELPRLNLPLHEELVFSRNGGALTDKAVFMNLKIISDRLGTFSFPVLYAFAVNETFYCNKLVPSQAIISHIIHVRYGGGLGGGGYATGIWLLNVLKVLRCELLISDGRYDWRKGDFFALEFCKSIPRFPSSRLRRIRVIKSQDWSCYGDVRWNLIL
jgi:hypothetical protein